MSGYPTARAISKPAGRDRIVIGGTDVTNFRGSRTPFPRYSLTEPYAYGATSIQFPQIHATLEYGNPAVIDLGWARKGAAVYIQRVLPDTSVITDYVGVVVSIGIYGRILNLDIGGRVSGRATLIDKPKPKVRRLRDIGRWMSLGCQKVHVPLTGGPLGPVTGIEIVDLGEMTHLGWLDQLHTMSQTISGTQRALMPVTWGKNPWQFNLKDYTTKHFTLFTEDARVVLTINDDASEEPNTWYGTGVAPDGEQWDNTKYPGYFETAADIPAYPITGGADFGLGTTDADTLTGDGIEVLKDKLVAMRYLVAGFGYDGTYSQDIYDAVHDLKNDAGLSDNGTMTPAAWNALFDVDVTGYSPVGAAIRPMRQATDVREWNESPNGNLLSRNDAFDPNVLEVDRSIDFGPGVDKPTGRKFIQGLAARAALGNWTGTIRLNGIGAFSDEWNGSDYEWLKANGTPYILSYRDLRPGQNAWLPLFGGGTLVHVVGIDVDPDGATLTVDSQARPLMEVSEIIARRRESRRDIRREWMVTNRGVKASGNMISRSEGFGKRPSDRTLAGGTWNVIPFVVGQSGQVNLTHIQLLPATEFVVAVFENKVTPKQLNHEIGDPFPLNADGESVWNQAHTADWRKAKNVLYAAGDETDPCGYGEHHKFRPDGTRTSAPLTGLHSDPAPWPYLSDATSDTVVWMAIYPRGDCTFKRGQVLYALADDVV